MWISGQGSFGLRTCGERTCGQRTCGQPTCEVAAANEPTAELPTADLMPAALRYTRMGPPTLAASVARSERAGASELPSHCANAMLDPAVGDRSGICQKNREFRCGIGPGANRLSACAQTFFAR